MRLVIAAALLAVTAALPNGWKARVDAPPGKEDLKVEEQDGTLTIATGAASALLYKPDMKAWRNYVVTAIFSELNPAAKPEAYGLVVGGVDLDKAVPKFLCFLVRHDGTFSIQRYTGAKARPVVAWRTALTMKESKGVQRSNTLSIRAAGPAVRFFVDDKEVAKLTRAQVGDGVAGLRVNAGLNLQVSRFEVKTAR